MAGRNHGFNNELSYFCRNTTLAQEDGVDLINATNAVSLFAKLILTPFGGESLESAKIQTTDPNTTLSLYCPIRPSVVTLNGTNQAIVWADDLLTINCTEPGEYVLNLQ
jgi:hypothetical protein